MQSVKYKLQNGFSLLETLVAVAILMGAVLGPLTLASQSIRSSGLSAERITAFFLAQEAMEFVRNQHDPDGLALFVEPEREWLDGLGDCRTDINADGCTINPLPIASDDAIQRCTGTCPLLPYGSVGAVERYGYDIPEFSVTSRKYRRTVKITPAGGQEDAEVEVEVSVEWETRLTDSGTDNFTVHERLFNWI